MCTVLDIETEQNDVSFADRGIQDGGLPSNMLAPDKPAADQQRFIRIAGHGLYRRRPVVFRAAGIIGNSIHASGGKERNASLLQPVRYRVARIVVDSLWIRGN